MPFLALADISAESEEEVKQHLAEEYAGSPSGPFHNRVTDAEKVTLKTKLENYDILIAYEEAKN